MKTPLVMLFQPTDMELSVVRATSGYVYFNGSRAIEGFVEKFNVNPLDWPQLFGVKNDVVVCTKKFTEIMNKESVRVHDNWTALGVGHDV